MKLSLQKGLLVATASNETDDVAVKVPYDI